MATWGRSCEWVRCPLAACMVCRPAAKGPKLYMLNAFRQQGLTSAVYGLIIVAMVVVFIVQFRPGAQGRSGSIRQECAAEIRGKCIEPKEYQAELMLVAPGRMIEASQMRALGIRKMVLDGLVER